MRAVLVLLFFCIAAPAIAKPKRAPEEQQGSGVRARQKEKLRAEPDADGKVVGKVRPRDKLELVDRSQDGRWVQVRKKRTTGWIEAAALDGLAAPVVAVPNPPAPAPAPAPPPAPIEAAVPTDPFSQGTAHYDRGEYAEAIARFEEGYRQRPDPVYLYNIAQAQRLAKRMEQALATYRRYLDEAPRAENLGEVDRHIAELEKAIGTAEAFRLAKEGRGLVKEKKTKEGLLRLREAVQKAEAAELDASDRADLYYIEGIALLRADREDDAVASLRKAAELSPRDADIRLDLATALRRAEDYGGAEAAAKEALRLGLKEDDKKSAETLLRAVRSERLHDRFSVDASVNISFDSNVLQGSRETIGNRFTGGARRSAPDVRRTGGVRTALQDIAQQYNTPAPMRSEFDLPIGLYLDLGVRLAGNRRVQFLAEYHFSQILMTLPASVTGSDHDAYSLQDHRLTLRLRSQPANWLILMLRAEGFANFSGLKTFTPFQGGFTGGLDATFKETRKLQTRLTFAHQYRASFDRSVQTFTNECNQSFTDTDTYLDGNRDDLGLIQELRLPWLKGRLGYQFHSDKSGVLQIDTPYLIPNPANPSQDIVLGCYNYQAPLSYLGHEVLLSGRFLLPLQFEIFASARYEHRAYADLYGARFHPNRVGSMDQSLGFLARRDHRLIAEVSVSKALPKGFGLELGYSYTRNISNIKNGIDNRNYDKHVASLWVTYSF